MPKNECIHVAVEGGVIQGIQFPVGCRIPVAVRDYDTDGVEAPDLEFDERGAPFVETLWEPGEQANSGAGIPVLGNAGDVAGHLSDVADAEARCILVELYRWMYWDDGRDCWSVDKDINGADTVQLLCELLPCPPEVSEETSRDDP